MSLFEKKEIVCRCSNDEGQGAAVTSACCGETIEGICCIKVLGSGCRSCHALYENAQSAVKAAGHNVDVEYITDLQKVMEYGVMTLPALVINEQVVSMGKILKPEDIVRLIKA